MAINTGPISGDPMGYVPPPPPPKQAPKWVDRKQFAEIQYDFQKVSEQINLRCDMMREMVGTLYPSILQDEINDLKRMLNGTWKPEMPENQGKVTTRKIDL
jgi:hypothetical protein